MSRFLRKTAGGASHRPAAASYDRPYGDTGRSGTQGFAGGLHRSRWPGSNGAGVAMVAAPGQAATVAEGLVVIQGLLEGGLGAGQGFGVPVGYPGGVAVL